MRGIAPLAGDAATNPRQLEAVADVYDPLISRHRTALPGRVIRSGP